jgi:hypothetical protein
MLNPVCYALDFTSMELIVIIAMKLLKVLAWTAPTISLSMAFAHLADLSVIILCAKIVLNLDIVPIEKCVYLVNKEDFIYQVIIPVYTALVLVRKIHVRIALVICLIPCITFAQTAPKLSMS